MKFLFSFLILFITLFASAQNDTNRYSKSYDYGWSYKRLQSRDAFIMPSDTINNKLGVAVLGNNIYIGNGTKWALSTGGSTSGIDSLRRSRDSIYARKNGTFIFQFKDSIGGGAIDTTSLSNRINTKLAIADTFNKWVSSVTKLNDSTIRVIKDGATSDLTLRTSSIVTSATRLITNVYNKSGATIVKGAVVYIDGAHSSNLPTIALAQANDELTSAYTYGLVENDISNNSSGVVIQSGTITNLNLPTNIYTDGQTLYLSPYVPGGYTLTKPVAPFHYVAIGTITRAHPTFGTIQVAIRNGFQLDEMSDVSIAVVPNDSSILQFSTIDSLWHDVDPTDAMGNRFVKVIDTTSMLIPYLRDYDTTSLISPYLRKYDTTSLISPYLRKYDTTSMLIPYLRDYDTTSLLSKYLRKYDTTSLISPYLRKYDTTSMLVPYLKKYDTTGGTNGNIIYKSNNTFQGNSNLFWDANNFRLGISQSSPTSKLHVNFNQNSVTQNDANGILLANSTSAISGTQSISPPLVWQGNGWKTTATAGSQVVKFRADVLPVQGTTNPTANWQLMSSINNGAYSDGLTILSTGGMLVGPTNYNPGRINISTFGTKTTTGTIMCLSSTETGAGAVYPSQFFISHEGASVGWSFRAVNQGVGELPIILSLNGKKVFVGTSTDAGYNFDVSGSGRFTSTLTTSGRISALTAKTGAYTALVTDEIITGNTTSGAFSITLPTAVGKSGQRYIIKKTDASANALTIATTSSQTIDASTTYSLSAQWKYVQVVSDGANWLIVSNN